ncbi:hypothetical protein S40285_07321 [Stachybotrys chlorohalonatus IBT 40285]|uniref:BAR domain-containing protein n=1 Tax=Stachybotrys chlorohalonatus (strain IBT 40285) TaxID=1283841 RepID=A0A084Q8D0_STAC4|nr:hypothetical protein S40285_07321 [Stachybotrys chlorohalonata IBT 40285]
MIFTKKIDRAFQWAGEKMGAEARTTHSEEFQMLETEMKLRAEGMDRLKKSTDIYGRWIGRRCDALEDKERSSPAAVFGRTMASHGDDFEPDSEFGAGLASIGRANERIAELQDHYAATVAAVWGDHIERNSALMKEYTAARKKLENRRLALDASTAKLQKARRDDYRTEDEVRTNKGKFEETSEDVLRRMQDVKEAEPESVGALASLLEAELEYHERAAEELRRVRQQWTGVAAAAPVAAYSPPRPSRRNSLLSRTNTSRSWQEPQHDSVYEEAEPQPVSVRMPIRSAASSRAAPPPPPQPPRPSMARAATYDTRQPTLSTRGSLTPLARIATDQGSYNRREEDIFADDASTSASGSSDIGDRSASPATSYGSLSRRNSVIGKKAPPPPPPNRAKKPAPPIPVRREHSLGY